MKMSFNDLIKALESKKNDMEELRKLWDSTVKNRAKYKDYEFDFFRESLVEYIEAIKNKRKVSKLLDE